LPYRRTEVDDGCATGSALSRLSPALKRLERDLALALPAQPAMQFCEARQSHHMQSCRSPE